MQETLENLKSLLAVFAKEEPVYRKLLQEDEVEKLAAYMQGDKEERTAYAEAFRARKAEERHALAYIHGILQLDPEFGTLFYRFMAGRFPETEIDAPPIVSRGMVGPSGMWPIYAVHPEFFADGDCQIFYTDEDIAGDADEAQSLAECIARESSGIQGACVRRLPFRSWAGRISEEPVYAVSFSLSPETLKRELPLKGSMVPIHEEEPYVVVIPKHGEYRTALGETRRFGKGQIHQVLASDYWCTK